ncbi:MAG: methyltransferase [Clostridia bacterium]|nr:methyltransferase [Clostridia bacterium]
MDKSIKLSKQPIGNNVYIYTSRHHGFGTDAVLLADFAKPKEKDRVIDLGTGCGIIPFLMLRDKNIKECIGVDISLEATEIAEKTAKENGFDTFFPINSNLIDLKGKVEFGKANLITCNPPYKAPNAGLKNPDNIDKAARHETECTLEDIIKVSAKLLQTTGRLCMCHRPERLAELLYLMREYKIEPKRLRTVAQRIGEEPWLVLVEGRRCGNTGLKIEPCLYIEENGDFSAEMKRIYGPYKENRL